MATNVVKSSGLTLDTREFTALAGALKAASPTLNVKMRGRLKAAVEVVAAEARSRVSGVSSSTVIKTNLRVLSGSVTAQSSNTEKDGSPSPISSLLELGNKGSGGGSTFRHPVFKRQNQQGTWVTQPTHPYLQPALDATIEEVTGLVEQALTDTFSELGFEMGGV